MTATRRGLLLIGITAAMALALGPRAADKLARAAACTVTANPANLQATINGAGPGTVICMDPGVYLGPVTFDRKSGITLQGAGHRVSIVAGGTKDAMLVFNSRDLTFRGFTLYFGHPSDAYVYNSQNVTFDDMEAGGGGIGIHYDVSSIGRISNSFVYAIEGDALLIRRKSNVTVDRNWVFNNGGVGVSTVGETATTTITHNIISDNRGPGVFAGQTPCALLPPGFVEIPDCYLNNLQAFVGDANIILDTNVIQASGSTGIVMFPGTRGTFRNNHIWRNELTGLFAWGASVTSEGDEFSGNEEHAIEFRAYPDPLKYPAATIRMRATGRINNADVHDSVVLAETGRLGGGILAQGANLDVSNSRVHDNRGIGISYVNTSLGSISGNSIFNNRGSAICVYRAGVVNIGSNAISGNVDNTPGDCVETTP